MTIADKIRNSTDEELAKILGTLNLRQDIVTWFTMQIVQFLKRTAMNALAI